MQSLGKSELRAGKVADAKRLATILRTIETEKHPWFNGVDHQVELLTEQ